MAKPLNIVFAGTPDFAAKHLDALIHSQHNIIGVYSQPDRPAGRGKKLQASAVKQLAQANDIAVYQPASLKTPEAQQQLAQLQPDILIVVAYGLILPQHVLDIPKLGCLNVHGSLLPRWRGAAPIQRAIWAGDEQTGVTIMQMDKGLDTGAMLYKQSIDIAQDDTSDSLYQKLAQLGPIALLSCLEQLDSLTPERQQDELANYAEKLSKQEAHIDWQQQACQLERNIRAFNPWPMAFFNLVVESNDDPVAIKVWQAKVVDMDISQYVPGQIIQADKNGILVATANQALLISQIQVPGKKAMPVSDILNAKKSWFETGKILS
ncbi:methionyl-tRNA formyltransferase [Aliiglaciecola litoralis]|uniref:Methionyl-tRNA formyltransferase n=1 Tax=Aliiglaciecola litoralis TaxID=582857 RepID=A0ABN1LTQ7_9ALTE